MLLLLLLLYDGCDAGKTLITTVGQIGHGFPFLWNLPSCCVLRVFVEQSARRLLRLFHRSSTLRFTDRSNGCEFNCFMDSLLHSLVQVHALLIPARSSRRHRGTLSHPAHHHHHHHNLLVVPTHIGRTVLFLFYFLSPTTRHFPAHE
uniref:Putative secreted peptide n=1 Tax=Anopheles braziliensis TaxID=58242 RepID=A0A2M3ZTT8_9DIPT